MRYLSTRGGDARPGFAEVLVEGLAPDGGLYVPESWPSPKTSTASTYSQMAREVIAPFASPDFSAIDLDAICEDAYSSFGHRDVAPLRQVGEDHYLLELFWGPTFSFKDYALQVVGQMLDAVLAQEGHRKVVLGATSGDTGSAAIHALRGRDLLEVVILYPKGRISEVQRRLMTTVLDENIWAVEIDGTFDDCQALVKSAFSDPELHGSVVAVNSINWARVAAQASYYFWAIRGLSTDKPIVFSVPTGNFGNALSGQVAAWMGAPIAGLIIANNLNRGVGDLVRHGVLETGPVHTTLAPAMDIQIPSNLERLLFELSGRDAAVVRAWQSSLLEQGRLTLAPEHREALSRFFLTGHQDDQQVLKTIGRVYAATGLILDPHTAIAWEVGLQQRPSGSQLVTIATAHPSKFASTVTAALGLQPPAPPALAEVLHLSERIIQSGGTFTELKSLLQRCINGH